MIDNEIHEIWVEDGIMFARYKPNVIVTKEIADKVVRERLEVSKGHSYPLCGDVTLAKKFTTEARNRLGEADTYQGIEALAIIQRTPFINAIVNFYLRISKMSPVPARAFRSVEAAKMWLLTYRQQN